MFARRNQFYLCIFLSMLPKSFLPNIILEILFENLLNFKSVNANSYKKSLQYYQGLPTMFVGSNYFTLNYIYAQKEQMAPITLVAKTLIKIRIQWSHVSWSHVLWFWSAKTCEWAILNFLTAIEKGIIVLPADKISFSMLLFDEQNLINLVLSWNKTVKERFHI